MTTAAVPIAVFNKRSKYRAQRTVVDGITFASKAEAQRYCELRLQEKAGIIRALRWQVEYPLLALLSRGKATVTAPDTVTLDDVVRVIGRYVADFDYVRTADGVHVVEDVKGFRTELYRWKAKHFALQYGFPITEIGGRKKAKRSRGGRQAVTRKRKD